MQTFTKLADDKNVEQLRAMADDKGYVSFIIPVRLYGIINAGDIDGMNEIVDEFTEPVCLCDLSYEAVGTKTVDDDSVVYIKVTGVIEDIDLIGVTDAHA